MEVDDRATSRPSVCVFAPTPLLTVTVESRPGDEADIHVHAGGQGPWIANMVAVLDTDVTLCGPFGGETGAVLRGVITRDRLEVTAVEASGGNGCYVEDRRSGEPQCIADMPPAVLNRHESDDLYNHALAAGLDAAVMVLSGPSDAGAVTADIYRRLAADLTSMGTTVVADLSGDALTAALEGGLSVLKVSHEDLIADGRAESEELSDLAAAMKDLATQVSRLVLVTRAAEPALALVEGELLEVKVPPLQRVDHRGAGDSMTAGVAAGLARGDDLRDAIRLGAAAGAVNVTRHGLASGQRTTIEQVAVRVEVQPMEHT